MLRLLFFVLFAALLSADQTQVVRVVDDNNGMISFDAFNRLEVAQPFTLADLEFKYAEDLSEWTTSATFNAAASLELQSGVLRLKATTNGDIAIAQTNKFYRYQAGKGGLVTLSLAPGDSLTGSIKEWGYYDGSNGLYFRLVGQSFYVCQISDTSGTATSTCVESASFNRAGRIGATSVAEFLANEDGATIFQIAFQWLGSGVTRFYMVDRTGHRRELHEFVNPTQNDGPYMRNAVLPIRMKVQGSVGQSTQTTMNLICCSVVSSGGSRPPVAPRAASMAAVYTTTAANEKSIFGLQLKQKFGTMDNRGQIDNIQIRASVLTAPMQLNVYKNSTFTAATWVSVGTSSIASYATTISSCSGGKLVSTINILTDTGGGAAADGFAQSGDSLTGFALSRNAFNTGSDSLCVTAKRLTATNATTIVDARWDEIR